MPVRYWPNTKSNKGCSIKSEQNPPSQSMPQLRLGFDLFEQENTFAFIITTAPLNPASPPCTTTIAFIICGRTLFRGGIHFSHHPILVTTYIVDTIVYLLAILTTALCKLQDQLHNASTPQNHSHPRRTRGQSSSRAERAARARPVPPPYHN